MMLVFGRVAEHYPGQEKEFNCPFGNYAGRDDVPFLDCPGIPGLLVKLRKILLNPGRHKDFYE